MSMLFWGGRGGWIFSFMSLPHSHSPAFLRDTYDPFLWFCFFLLGHVSTFNTVTFILNRLSTQPHFTLGIRIQALRRLS